MGDEKLSVELAGVSETLLWTLYQRAVEARRSDSLIRDPLAIELTDRIDYPFGQRFGGRFGQWQALRARCFDGAVRRFLAAHPDGTVVALGEGLETQFWRIDNGGVHWLSVDVPDVMALRERLLPRSSRQSVVAGSAFDRGWMAEVDATRGVLITAQGLFMYFERADVHELIGDCARRFPDGKLVFDAVPAWLSEWSKRNAAKGGEAFRPPPWLWGASAAEAMDLAALPSVRGVSVLRPGRGRGIVHGFALPTLRRFPRSQRVILTVFELTFGSE